MSNINQIERQTIVEMMLYILNKTRGLDYYRVFKILYFAERSFMAKYGMRMTQTEYHALKFGPVPQQLYDAIKGVGNDTDLIRLVTDAIYFGEGDANYYLVPKRSADLSFLSACAQEELDTAIEKYSQEPFALLMQQSHGLDWQVAREKSLPIIDPIDMAREGGASDAAIRCIKEDEEWANAFN